MSVLEKSSDVWRRIYSQYEDVLRAKAETMTNKKKRQELLTLDKWYQQELPAAIIGRSERYIKHEELAKVMQWKLLRGKFRPRLQQLVEGNGAESVEAASKKAFKVLPNLRSGIEALVVLKGVGPATASAVLAAGAPDIVPFMADESMLALPGLQPLSYTCPAFLNFAKQVAEIAKSLQKQDKDFGWTSHKVELVLWTVEMAKKVEKDDILSLLKSNSTGANGNKMSSPSSQKRKPGSDNNPASKKKAKV